MQDLLLFDANCMIGGRAWRRPREIRDVGELLADLEYHDIHAALVHHAAAAGYSQDYGNRRLLDEIAGHPRLVPQWVLLPHHTHEMAPADELVSEMLALNVRAARLFPRSQGFGTSDAVCGALLAKLQEHRLPLFVDLAEVSVPEAVGLCQRYPHLPVVLCGMDWSHDRLLYALLPTVPNLVLDTWAFQGHRAYERFVKAFGADRLLFSTGLPERSPGAARMMVVYEQIDEAARRNIGAVNLLRLLADVRGASGPAPDLRPYPASEGGEPPVDPIIAQVRAGQPLRDELVIDAHAHLGHPGCMGVYEWAIAHDDADGLVATMDRLGINLACASSWGTLAFGDEAGNDVAVAAKAKYPGRICPYGSANPNHPGLVEAELARVFESGLVCGFKPYPKWHHVPLTDPRNRPLLEFCHRKRRPVLCHMYFDERDSVIPDHVDRLAAEYPGASFLCGHAGQSWEMAAEVVRVARKHANLFAEITYPGPLYAMVEYLAEEIGPERVLFGTDCVMQDAAPQLGWVAWARLPVTAKRLILGRNMARILGNAGEAVAAPGV